MEYLQKSQKNIFFVLVIIFIRFDLYAYNIVSFEQDSIKIDAIISAMSTEEKVGQLMLVGFPGTTVSGQAKKWIQERKVAGVVLFSRNIRSLEQIIRFTREIQALTKNKIPLLIGLDQEGGNVFRLKEGTSLLPGNMALGATRSFALAYGAGQSQAVDLKRIGFNMNFAPVLDVNSNAKNSVIGIRSFGDNPELVGTMGKWFVKGQQGVGVISVGKHFPGHGNTAEDSHYAIPKNEVDINRLNGFELIPFKAAIGFDIDAIMMGHIALPLLHSNANLPATLSFRLITEILRNQLGFDGVVITDGLEMKSIANYYESGAAAVAAILAGVDLVMILWKAKKKEEVYNALLDAVKNGIISQKRLNESLKRILYLKKKRDLFVQKFMKPENVIINQNINPLHNAISERIATESITLVRNDGNFFPLSETEKIIIVAPKGSFADYVETQKNILVLRISQSPKHKERKKIKKRLMQVLYHAKRLLFVVDSKRHMIALNDIIKAIKNVPIGVISFSSPYLISSINHVDAYVCTYSRQKISQIAVAKAILGKNAMTGRLPVSISGFYQYGHNVNY